MRDSKKIKSCPVPKNDEQDFLVNDYLKKTKLLLIKLE